MSVSPSASPSPSPGWANYTRGDENALPGNDDDLENVYSEQDYTDVATKDDVRVEQTASDEYALHQFKDYVGGSPSAYLEWEGQSDLAPSQSKVVLQIYNQNTTTWDDVAENNAENADTDFVLEGNIADLTNYKTPQNTISCRVYQEAK